MKISYVHGPGDAFGTFLGWQEGRADGSIIKQTYSGQFYDLVAETGAISQVICVTPTGATTDPRFRFDTVPRARGSGVAHYLREFQYARAVGAKVRDFGPDVVIVHSDFPTYAFAALPSRPARVLTIHNTFWLPYGAPTGVKETLLSWARGMSLRGTDHAVCVSLECKRQFEKARSGSPVFAVVQIPRLPQNFQEEREHDPRKLLYVGRIEIAKGVSDLIEAFSRVRDRFPGLELKIVGDGSALGQLRDLARELGLGSAVEFTGRLDAQGVGRAYAEADLCFCPTRWTFNEGLATVPLEAASYGVPTVMSRAVPAREQFGDGALVFEPGDVGGLTSTIERVLSDRQVYREARDDARESYLRTMRDVGDWKAGMLACLSHVQGRA